MVQIFKTVLTLSCLGSLLALILLMLKPVTRRVFGSAWQYYIWISVLIICVLPIKFNIPYGSDLNFGAPLSQTVNMTDTQNFSDKEAEIKSNEVQVTEYEPPVQETTSNEKPTINIIKILCLIWISGVCLFILSGIISYLRFWFTVLKNSEIIFCRQLENLKHINKIKREITVRQTPMLNTPLLTGIFKPTLVMPCKKLSESEITFVLMHELKHYKRRDLIYKWFAFIVNAVHWFNPFIYLTIRQINDECEISCDLAVTRNMDNEEKKGYMRTIINLASDKGGITDV